MVPYRAIFAKGAVVPRGPGGLARAGPPDRRACGEHGEGATGAEERGAGMYTYERRNPYNDGSGRSG